MQHWILYLILFASSLLGSSDEAKGRRRGREAEERGRRKEIVGLL